MEEQRQLSLKEIAEVLGQHARDERNKNVGIQQRIDYFDRLTAAVQQAQKVAGDVAAVKAGIESDVTRLTQERETLERTLRTLRHDTQAAKETWRAAQQDVEAKRQELAGLQAEVEAASAHIQRGQEAQRILASIGTH